MARAVAADGVSWLTPTWPALSVPVTGVVTHSQMPVWVPPPAGAARPPRRGAALGPRGALGPGRPRSTAAAGGQRAQARALQEVAALADPAPEAGRQAGVAGGGGRGAHGGGR